MTFIALLSILNNFQNFNEIFSSKIIIINIFGTAEERSGINSTELAFSLEEKKRQKVGISMPRRNCVNLFSSPKKIQAMINQNIYEKKVNWLTSNTDLVFYNLWDVLLIIRKINYISTFF